MSVFADSSALVKCYADEPDYELVRIIPIMLVSQLARVEVPSALWRKHRNGALTRAQAHALVTDFAIDYEGTQLRSSRFEPVATTDRITATAAELCFAHSLRAYDAVQLASAIAARGVDAGCDTFAVFDRPLRDAAAAEGFALLPSA